MVRPSRPPFHLSPLTSDGSKAEREPPLTFLETFGSVDLSSADTQRAAEKQGVPGVKQTRGLRSQRTYTDVFPHHSPPEGWLQTRTAAATRVATAVFRFELQGVAHQDVRLFVHAADFLAIALARQRRFDAAFLARRHIELMTLHVFDDVLLLHLAFETAERAFQRFSFADFNFCQTDSPPLLAQNRSLRDRQGSSLRHKLV